MKPHSHMIKLIPIAFYSDNFSIFVLDFFLWKNAIFGKPKAFSILKVERWGFFDYIIRTFSSKSITQNFDFGFYFCFVFLNTKKFKKG